MFARQPPATGHRQHLPGRLVRSSPTGS